MLVGWDMNQHLILCWVSQPNLPKLLTKCFASRKNDTVYLEVLPSP